MAANGCDMASEVPPARWSIESLELTNDIRQRSAFASFMMGLEMFDSKLFSLSPAEAICMDPQQRLLLEHGYHAAHAAGR
eukprot:280877-Prymnesium_polylepis.1